MPYSVHRRVLNCEEYGLIIDSKTYYNLVRNERGDKNKERIISGLLIALDDAKFKYRTRVETELDRLGRPINRKLIQIVFWHPQAVS